MRSSFPLESGSARPGYLLNHSYIAAYIAAVFDTLGVPLAKYCADRDFAVAVCEITCPFCFPPVDSPCPLLFAPERVH
jgi:hypothetical protein